MKLGNLTSGAINGAPKGGGGTNPGGGGGTGPPGRGGGGGMVPPDWPGNREGGGEITRDDSMVEPKSFEIYKKY